MSGKEPSCRVFFLSLSLHFFQNCSYYIVICIKLRAPTRCVLTMIIITLSASSSHSLSLSLPLLLWYLLPLSYSDTFSLFVSLISPFSFHPLSLHFSPYFHSFSIRTDSYYQTTIIRQWYRLTEWDHTEKMKERTIESKSELSEWEGWWRWKGREIKRKRWRRLMVKNREEDEGGYRLRGRKWWREV